MRLVFIALTAISIYSTASLGQQPAAAPLGLRWGATIEETRSQGIEVGEATETTSGKAYQLSKLPQVLADQEVAHGFFGYDNHLFRLAILSKSFPNDPYGNAVRARYSELSDILSEKYGKSSPYHKVGDSIYAEPRYFIAGLQNGRSLWYSNFKSQDLTIQLGIIGESSDASRWRIIYENNALQGSFEKSKRVKERGAL
jgi:hypothetical protein